MISATYVDPSTGLELAGRPGINGYANRRRAEMYARAEYYAWSARRHPTPLGNDPISGFAWQSYRQGDLATAIGRAQDRAAALECYRRAREMWNPFSGLRTLEELRRG